MKLNEMETYFNSPGIQKTNLLVLPWEGLVYKTALLIFNKTI